jgi:hypothetical protein
VRDIEESRIERVSRNREIIFEREKKREQRKKEKERGACLSTLSMSINHNYSKRHHTDFCTSLVQRLLKKKNNVV